MAPADPVVSTSAGRVRGRIEKGIAVFRGIPFAQPPIGPLRFQAPEPPAPWDDVREAKEFGPAPPQAVMLAEAGGQPARPADGTGDWLTVNVWTPDPAATRLPVLVWIYGGAYMFGGSGEPGYDGSPFAQGGAVFASKAGAPENPAWFHNLLAQPLTTVELGTRTVRVRARLAQPAERDVIYSRQKQRSPVFARYEAMAAPRRIPVVVLDPIK